MTGAARLTIISAFICLAPGMAFAQTSASVISTRPALSVDKVKQGARFQAALVVDISSGYHINSSRPSESYLIATALKLEKKAGITAGPVLYPRGQNKKFSFSDKPLSVYEGRAVLKFSATASSAVPVGNNAIHGKLTVQACNDQACLQPKTIDVEIPFEVVTSSTQVNPANGDIFGARGGKRR
jgi:thioredoxin:protein disulfide reductase